MRYILLPIHPEWCCKLMNGDKETEVRRGTALYNAIDKLIKVQGKAPCLIYCTRGKPTLLPKNKYRSWFAVAPYGSFERNPLNGKVVAMFEAQPDRIFNVRYGADEDECAREHGYETSMLGCEDLERSSCLEYDQLLKYLGKEWDDGYIGTAIHVKRGTMRTDGFPKELKEFKHPCKHKGLDCEECVKLRIEGKLKDKPYCHYGTSIERAPQSWCYAEAEE